MSDSHATQDRAAKPQVRAWEESHHAGHEICGYCGRRQPMVDPRAAQSPRSGIADASNVGTPAGLDPTAGLWRAGVFETLHPDYLTDAEGEALWWIQKAAELGWPHSLKWTVARAVRELTYA